MKTKKQIALFFRSIAGFFARLIFPMYSACYRCGMPETPFYECDRWKWTVPALRELLEGHDTAGQAAPLQEAVRNMAQKRTANPA